MNLEDAKRYIKANAQEAVASNSVTAAKGIADGLLDEMLEKGCDLGTFTAALKSVLEDMICGKK